MADAFTLTTEQDKIVPVKYKTAAGNPAAPAAGGSVSSDHPELATGSLEPDNAGVRVHGVAAGVAVLSLVFNGHTDTMETTVTAPAADAASLDPASAVDAPAA